MTDALALPPLTTRLRRRHEVVDGAFLASPLAFVRHYVSSRPGLFTALISVAFLAAAISVGVQYGMKLLVDALSGSNPDPATAWRTLGIFIGLIAVESVLWRSSGWLAAKTTITVGVDIRLDLLDYMIGHPVRYFQDNLAGSLGHRITATAGAFGVLTNRMVWDVAPPIINFIGAIIVFATLDVGMTITLGIFAVAITAGLIGFGLRGRELHRNYAERSSTVGGELVDVIANVWAVKAFSARKRERKRLEGAFSQEARAQRRSWMYTEKSRILHDVLLLAMAGTMLVWSMMLWQAGSITTGDIVIVSALTFRILHGSRDLALALVDVTQHLAYLSETLRLVGQPHEIADAPEAGSHVPRLGAITFEHVSFGYADGRRVIDDLCLEIPAGQTVGIVGPSGAGKSTLVQILQRLHDVSEGRILIDGQPVTALKQDNLRAGIAAVPQEVTLFHRSIGDNIRFARPDAADEDVILAAAASYCDEFIRQMPHGYDTMVGERGAKLSGGQRQRIGIARAFLKEAPIVVLDEATSGLDTESEMKVQSALARLMHDRTVIAVAHRLSTIASFDRIIVLVGGEVVEDGPPAVLRASGGVFARMWTLQAEGLSVDEIVSEGPAAVDASQREPATV